MSTDKNDQEPSMEEILSSIRRIIADDQDEDAAGRKPEAEPAKGKATQLPAVGPAPDPAEDDVLELTQVVGSTVAAPAPSLDDDELELEPDDEPGPAPAPPKPTAARPVATEEALVSAPAAAASASAFARLARAAAGGTPTASRGIADKTVEAFLTELLRPMLKDWLDQHLESVVERVVEQEVKKLARRAELM